MIRNASLYVLLTVLECCLATGVVRGDDRPVVYTSNYPIYFFATEIAGSEVDVRLPQMEGDPAYWAPNSDQTAELQAADLVLLNGAGYENWLNFVSLHKERLVDTSAGLADSLLPLMEAAVHQHGPEGEHSHVGTAFTTWLDPKLAAGQAHAITAALVKLKPEQEAGFNDRLARLQRRLKQLDLDLDQVFTALGDQPVVFSHPVYQYLESRYSINGRSVHWEPDAVPNSRQWIDFQKLLAGHPAKLMIWEGEPLPEVSDKLAQQGLISVVFDPAGNRPEHGDYFEVMENNRQRLLTVLGML